MKHSPQIQSRINAVAKDLENGKERDEILRKYAKKWQIAPRTIDRYLNPAKEIAKKRSNLANKVAEDTITAEMKEAVKSGLKSKLERVMLLQDEADKCLLELKANVEFEHVVIGGKMQKVSRPMTVVERSRLRQSFYQLQSEISKIQGDYAPVKAANTDAEGKFIPPPTHPIYPRAVLMEFLKEANG